MRSSSACAAAAAALLTAGGASANSRFPASNQIVLSPSDTNLVVVRATYGILVSHDHGTSWSWTCEDSLGLPANNVEDPELALTASGALIAGLDEPVAALDVSPDTGCNWQCVGGPLQGLTIVDLSVPLDAPDAPVVLASEIGGDAGATALRVFGSIDDGAHWTAVGAPLDPTILATTIDAAGTGPQRLYVSATRGIGAARTASLFVSIDAGASWTERPVPFDPATDGAIYIGGVDPTNPDRVYLRTDGVPPHLLVTADQGQTFQSITVALTGPMKGFAVAPDGATVFAGSEEDGLFAASSVDFAFHKTSSVHVQCLAARGAELWACSDAPSGFIAGVSIDGGNTFAPKLQLNGISRALPCAPHATAGSSVACGADANASQCGGAVFENFCSDLGGCAVDAGNTSAQPAPAPTRPASCGCSGPGTERAAGAAAALLPFLLLARRWRSRRGDVPTRG